MKVAPATSMCAAPGCGRPARHGRWCWGHRKRLQRDGELGGPLRTYGTAWERVYEAFRAYTLADTPDDVDRADSRFRKALDELYLERGWKPPARGGLSEVVPG